MIITCRRLRYMGSKTKQRWLRNSKWRMSCKQCFFPSGSVEDNCLIISSSFKKYIYHLVLTKYFHYFSFPKELKSKKLKLAKKQGKKQNKTKILKYLDTRAIHGFIISNNFDCNLKKKKKRIIKECKKRIKKRSKKKKSKP